MDDLMGKIEATAQAEGAIRVTRDPRSARSALAFHGGAFPRALRARCSRDRRGRRHRAGRARNRPHRSRGAIGRAGVDRRRAAGRLAAPTNQSVATRARACATARSSTAPSQFAGSSGSWATSLWSRAFAAPSGASVLSRTRLQWQQRWRVGAAGRRFGHDRDTPPSQHVSQFRAGHGRGRHDRRPHQLLAGLVSSGRRRPDGGAPGARRLRVRLRRRG